MSTPPSTNPQTYCARNHKHWADPTEIKPGVFSIMQGSGPKATSRDFVVVKHHPTNKHHQWQIVGVVSRPRYGYVGLDVGWLEGRTWKLLAPEDAAPELVAMLIDIAKKYA